MILHNNDIVACVVTFNRKQKLKICIEKLLEQTYKEFDILIVDNNSTDGTYELIDNYIKLKKIQYKNTGSNLGGAGGFNFAIREVVKRYKYIWVMDDDTYPKKDALSALVEKAIMIDGDFAFLSSLVEWVDGNSCLMNQQLIELDIYKSIRKVEKGLIPIRAASFVSLFINSESVFKYGLPIKEFFLWGDDVEYTKRMSAGGGYLVFDSQVVHAMDANDGVDVCVNDYRRVSRYHFFIRNRVYIAKEEKNINEVFRAYLSAIKQIFRVLLFASDYKLERIKIICKGIIESFGFKPQIEYIDK